jgi:hypothetical protein
MLCYKAMKSKEAGKGDIKTLNSKIDHLDQKLTPRGPISSQIQRPMEPGTISFFVYPSFGRLRLPYKVGLQHSLKWCINYYSERYKQNCTLLL